MPSRSRAPSSHNPHCRKQRLQQIGASATGKGQHTHLSLFLRFFPLLPDPVAAARSSPYAAPARAATTTTTPLPGQHRCQRHRLACLCIRVTRSAGDGGSLPGFLGTKNWYAHVDDVLPQEPEDGGSVCVRADAGRCRRYVFAFSALHPSTTSCSATVRRAPLEWRFVLGADLVLLVRLEVAVAFPSFGDLFKTWTTDNLACD